MAATSMIASAASGAMNTVGSYFAASGQRSALKLQARLDEVNAQIADAQARDSLLRGERSEQALRQEVGQVRSRQRVAMAGNNIDLGSETAAAVLTSTDVMGEMDATTIRANALREAWGLRTEAGNLRSSARMNRATAKTISPLMQAGGTFLTDAARFGGQFHEFKQSGALDTSKERWGNIGAKVKGWMGG
jgi:hypothetical protein